MQLGQTHALEPEIRERVEADLQRYSQVPSVGQIARRLGLMDADAVLRVLNHQQTSGQLFCAAAVSLGVISGVDVEQLLAEQRRLRAAATLDGTGP